MNASTLFQQYSNFIVEKCEYDGVNKVMFMTLVHPENDKKNEVVFKNVKFYNFLLDEQAHQMQEDEDLPSAFVSLETEIENLGVTKHKQDWFKAFDFEFNTRIVCSDFTILLRVGSIEVDGMDVEDYPDIVELPPDNRLFYSDEELEELEQNGQWEESIAYLKTKWEESPNVKSIIFRYAVQNWYALTYKDQCGMDSREQRTALKANLKEVNNYVKRNMATDSNYLWIFGYMMETNPFAFVSVITYTDEVKINGRKLITEAANAEPENLMAQVMALADEKKMNYKKKKKQLKPYLSEYFPGQSAVEKHFLSLFDN